MKTNFSLLFYLKKSKNYQNGPVAIYMRITVNGKRSEITTGRSCEPEKWIVATGRINGKKEGARSLNAYLTDLQMKQSTLLPPILISSDRTTCYKYP